MSRPHPLHAAKPGLRWPECSGRRIWGRQPSEVQAMRYAAWAGGLVLGIGLLLIGGRAEALITREMPLKGVLTESRLIFTAKIDALDPDKPAVVLTVEDDLKG